MADEINRASTLNDRNDGSHLISLRSFATYPDQSTDAVLALSATITVGTTMQLANVTYASIPGGDLALDVEDIHEHHCGDCYLLSAASEFAVYYPAKITKMIDTNENGNRPWRRSSMRKAAGQVST